MGTTFAAALVSKVTIKLISLCDLEKAQVPILDRWRSLQVRGRDGDVNKNAIPHTVSFEPLFRLLKTKSVTKVQGIPIVLNGRLVFPPQRW